MYCGDVIAEFSGWFKYYVQIQKVELILLKGI